MQPITATSTHEAELIALTFAADEAVWLKRLLLEANISKAENKDMPIPVMCDNQGTVFTVHNPNQNQRSKHLDIRYYKCRQYIEQGLINVLHVRTNLNIADFFTKSLATPAFKKFRNIILGTYDLSGDGMSRLHAIWRFVHIFLRNTVGLSQARLARIENGCKAHLVRTGRTLLALFLPISPVDT